MPKSLTIAVAALLSAAIACADSVGPEERALDGPWSTGPLIVGLDMALDLTWTSEHVTGSGGYSAMVSGVHCGSATISDTGTVVLSAARPSRNEIRGQMTFGAGPTFQFKGTLVDTLSFAGSAKIEGILVAADGTQCELPIRQGLIP